MLYPNFRKCMIERALLGRGDRIVAAVSGGIDSMVLLDLLCRISRGMDLSIIAAHVNHGLRGRSSDGDESLVREAAERYGIPVEVSRRKPPKGKNLQDAARRLRYDFFSKVAIAHGATSVCVAHHAGDQAETVLLHLLRGAGLQGLRGMSFSSMHGWLRIVRPLLGSLRKEIERYARERRIRFREDETNAKVKYRRNSVRHRLMPLLREFNPRIEETLARTALRLADDDEAMNAVSHASLVEALAADAAPDGRGIALNVDTYCSFPASIRRRMLRLVFARAAGSARDLNSDQLARMDQIACGEKPRGEYRLPGGFGFRRDGRLILIQKLIGVAPQSFLG